jgi:hypothetical protein
LVADDITCRANLAVKRQSAAPTSGQKQVSVGMHTAAKIKVRAGKITKITLRKHSKLKYRNLRDLNSANQAGFLDS